MGRKLTDAQQRVSYWHRRRTDILVAKSGSLYGRLDKPMSTGGVASLVHAWNYVPNNLASQTFNSRFAGFLRGEFRQPLLAGSGRDFTEVAGPISRINPNPGRGVAIARLDQNITVAEFESRLQLLLKQTLRSLSRPLAARMSSTALNSRQPRRLRICSIA